MFSGELLKPNKRPELSAEDKQTVAALINMANKAAKIANDYYGQPKLPAEQLSEQVVSEIISEELDYDEDAA